MEYVTDLESPYSKARFFEAISYFNERPKHTLSFHDNAGKEHAVLYVLASEAFIHYLSPGEKFGIRIGDAYLISSQIASNHPTWVNFVVIKLYTERFVDPGLDMTGRTQHFLSMSLTLRLAGAIMQKDDLLAFIRETMKYESERYFQIDREIRKFVDENGGPNANPIDILEKHRGYLEKHRFNRWVKIGRSEEELAIAYPSFHNLRIYHNYGESVASVIPSHSIITAQKFIQFMHGVDPEEAVLLDPEMSSIAYLFTTDGNGVIDLLFFSKENTDQPKHNIIFKVPKKEKTWGAVERRLAYRIHKAEQRVQAMIEFENKRLESTTQKARSLQKQTAEIISSAKTAFAESSPLGIEKARTVLCELSGEYSAQMKQLGEVIEGQALIIKELDSLGEILRNSI
jgi:hypothetical protein